MKKVKKRKVKKYMIYRNPQGDGFIPLHRLYFEWDPYYTFLPDVPLHQLEPFYIDKLDMGELPREKGNRKENGYFNHKHDLYSNEKR